MLAVVLKNLLRDAQVSHGSISQNQSQGGALDLALRLPRATKGYWINGSGLAFEGCQP